ncbi:MAG: hypothetical protein KatS3mg011_1763 [Acidimicrobiia bacterium]|nr:MAG: hypothetical protein KatS3mg011_1763 [Acidimicrobiia bacterium]
MSTIPFVDTHVHFWDRPHPTLQWAWLEPDFTHPQLGDIELLKEMARYTAEEYLEECADANVAKAVHVQAAIGSQDPVEETRWLQAMADATGWPQAIIGDARMQQPDVERTIERHTEYPNFRGIRDFAEGDYLVDPNFHRGYALLEKYNLVYDLDVVWQNFHKAAAMAAKFPNIPLVVDHAGFPQSRTAEYFYSWRKALNVFANLDNVYIKISGLGMGDHMAGRRWTIETIRPWVESCLEVFGTERSFFGTNWPVDKMFSDFSAVIDAYRTLISDFSEAEQRSLLSENAERVYRL